MQATLGQAIVVDNRPGAGSINASQAVAHATPDGHTLLLLSNGHAVAPSLFKKLPFDAQADFAPICLLARFDLALFVPATSRFKTLAELIQHARSEPGTLTLGSVAVGSTQHLAAMWFKQLAGIDLLVVPYKATPAVLGALRGGEIDAAFEIVGPWLPQLGVSATAGNPATATNPAARGVLRALAVGSTQRFAGLPGVPTVAEAGGPRLQRFDATSWNGLAAPVRTPPAVLAQLNQAANQALAQLDVQRQLRALGVRAQGGTPDQLRQWLAAQTRHWAAVVRAAGIEAS